MLGYVTNASNPDTDFDLLRDDYEYGNHTIPISPDTDDDGLLDGDEIFGTFGYITNYINKYSDNPIDPNLLNTGGADFYIIRIVGDNGRYCSAGPIWVEY